MAHGLEFVCQEGPQTCGAVIEGNPGMLVSFSIDPSMDTDFRLKPRDASMKNDSSQGSREVRGVAGCPFGRASKTMPVIVFHVNGCFGYTPIFRTICIIPEYEQSTSTRIRLAFFFGTWSLKSKVKGFDLIKIVKSAMELIWKQAANSSARILKRTGARCTDIVASQMVVCQPYGYSE